MPAWLAAVNPRTNTPVTATLLCGLFAATMALIFDIESLADMMSIGTLISYTLVSTSILVLRFRDTDVAEAAEAAAAPAGASGSPLNGAGGVAAGALTRRASPFGAAWCVMSDGSLSVRGRRVPKGTAVVHAVLAFVAGISVAVTAAAVAAFTNMGPGVGMWVVAGFAAAGLALAAVAAVAIYLMPSQRPANVSFLTPLFPHIPLLSIAVNLYLLANLSYLTWIRFAVWCVIGGWIYFGYGMKHSKADSSVGGGKSEAEEEELESQRLLAQTAAWGLH